MIRPSGTEPVLEHKAETQKKKLDILNACKATIL